MLLGSKALGTCAVMGGVPAVLSKFAWSLVRLMIFSRETLCGPVQHIHFDPVDFSDHSPARNVLAGRFLGDWLLMLDCDHDFEPDLLVRLLDVLQSLPDCAALTALYRFKSPPHSPVLYAWGEKEQLQPIASWTPKDVRAFEIGAAGGGCLLIRRETLEAVQDSGEQPFDRLPGYSEDLSFFLRLKRLRLKAYCAPQLEARHLRVAAVEEADYAACAADLSVSEPFAVTAFGAG